MNSLFAQVGDPMNVDGILLLLPLLLLVALVLGASVLVSHRNNSWKVSFTQCLGSLLWASPVIAVLAFVGVRVAPQFQFGTETHQPKDASPTWLQSDDDVVDVPSFVEHTTPVSLEEESTSEDSLPAWTSQDVLRLGSTKRDLQNTVWRVVAESDWEKSVEEAREDVLDKTAGLVQEDFSQFYPGGSALPKEAIKDRVVRAEAVGSQVHEHVDAPFTMYKVYWQVELSPNIREELSGTWKQEVAVQRAWLLGLVIALLTLIWASFAAYFHLDKKSGGAHRFRLKLAATALMTAGALGVLATLPHV